MDEKNEAQAGAVDEKRAAMDAEVARRLEAKRAEAEIEQRVAEELERDKAARKVEARAPLKRLRVPDVGEVVHYFSKQNQEKEKQQIERGNGTIMREVSAPRTPWAAMVIKVNGSMVDLNIHPADGGTYIEKGVPYSQTAKRGTWRFRDDRNE